MVKPHPPLIRAMNIVKNVLEREGHQGKLFPLTIPNVPSQLIPIVIDWEPLNHIDMYKNAVRSRHP